MKNVVSAPKTDMFRIRINPELRRQLEEVYEKNGLTLTDAVNVFFQQSLNAGGFPFAVNENNAEIIKGKAMARLMKELAAAQNDPVTHSEEDVYAMFGVEKLSLIHISEPTRQAEISYAVFCLKKKKKNHIYKK